MPLFERVKKAIAPAERRQSNISTGVFAKPARGQVLGSEPTAEVGHDRHNAAPGTPAQYCTPTCPSAERVTRAANFRIVCRERGVSVRQLARHWDLHPKTAHNLLRRESGPPSEKLRLLPSTLQAALKARSGQ